MNTETKKMMTNEEINKAIVTSFENEIKFKEESRAVLKYLAEHYIVPNDIDWLNVELKCFKKWRIEKAIKELKSKKYIVACAIECTKINNQKDSFKLTNRGTRLVKELFNFNETKSLSNARKAPIACRKRNIARMMFDDNLSESAEFYSTDFLFENVTKSESLPLRGSMVDGFLFTEESYYLIYSLSNSNIPIYEASELNCVRKMNIILKKDIKLDFINNGFNRMIIVDSSEIVMNLFSTRKNAKWFFNDGKFFRRAYDHSLFYPEESIFRGKVIVLVRSIAQRETISSIYSNPELILSTTDEIIKKVVELQQDRMGIPVEVKKYPLATVETNLIIVINLIVQDLRRLLLFSNILNDENEKRKVVIFTTKKQESFIKECFSEYQNALYILATDENDVVEQVKTLNNRK